MKYLSSEVVQGNIPLVHDELAVAEKVSFIKQNWITGRIPKLSQNKSR